MNSFAAGTGAQAMHDGAFVWGDSSGGTIASIGTNQFIVRAAGGIWFGTNSSPSFPAGSFIATSTGAYLSTAGFWINASDRNLKENFAPVDNHSVLDRVAKLPILTWNSRSESRSIRHMGPMAQDFRAAFGLGEDDKHISTVDSEGVALAAIQELYREMQKVEARSRESEVRSQKKDAKIKQQAEEIRRLAARVEALQKAQEQMASLETRLARMEAAQRTLELKTSADGPTTARAAHSAGGT